MALMRAHLHGSALRVVLALAAAVGLAPSEAYAQLPPRPDSGIVTTAPDSVLVRLIDVDVRSAVQLLSAYLDRPVTFGALGPGRVTLETPRPVHRKEIPQLLRGMLQSNDLELVADTLAALYRVQERERPRVAVSQRAAAASSQAASVPQLWVIRLSHARADDVAAIVNSLYEQGGALGEPGPQRRTLRDQLQDSRLAPAGGGTPAEQSTATSDTPRAASQRSAALTGDITIVPDPGTNSLLIRASREDYELILAAVEQVDVRPLQVLIEVLIAEARKDRSLSFGVDASLPTASVPGTDNTTVSATALGLGLGDFALRVMGIGGHDINATLRAAASRGDVTIASRPVILTANNEPAEILVGSQRPFVQVSRSLPTDTPQRDQVIQYRDVGTRLSVKPTISADGYVMLEVVQEVNAATNEFQFEAPIISTRSVSTQLLVKDGQTVVLGGLTDRQRDRNQGGMPILSGIPLLGGLFGRVVRRSNETELFLFITPKVIRTDEEAEELTRPPRERARRIDP